MAYLALYRKYRPKVFADVVGQKQVSETLVRAIESDKVAHAYLFAGPRGTGKTSMAKIFARSINCVEGPTATPCGQCTACKQILAGQSMDVLEIDAASNRGIDEIRTLRENVKFMPVEGRKKIFIIDEAHMLTTEAWNALLKTIEEPPAHVMFIFATTEAEKLPVTILSRCQRYTFRRITADDIVGRLQYVANQEGFELDPKAARLIAIHADGGMRDALSILDQCAGMAGGLIDTELVENLIGLVSKEWVMDLLNRIHKGDGAGILSAISQALVEGRDPLQILDALIRHVRALLIGKVAPEEEELALYDTVKETFLAQSQAFSVADINRYVHQFQSIQGDAKGVDNPRTIVEMGLLVMCAESGSIGRDLESRIASLEARESRQEEAILNRLTKLEAGGGRESVRPSLDPSYGDQTSYPMPDEEFPEPSMPEPSQQEERGSSPLSQNPLPKVSPLPKVKPLPKSGASQGPSPQSPPPIPVGAPVTIGQGLVDAAQYRTIQGNVINYLKSHQRSLLATVLNQSQLIYVDASKVVFVVKSALNYSMLTNVAHAKDIGEACYAFLGHAVAVEAVKANSPQAAEYKAAVQKGGAPSQEASGNAIKADPEAREAVGHKWDPANMSPQEAGNPMIKETLSKLSEEYDIYVEDK